MKTIKLKDYLAGIEARKAMLAPAAVPDEESWRNNGSRRTAKKREALKLAEARAKAAEVQPIRSNY